MQHAMLGGTLGATSGCNSPGKNAAGANSPCMPDALNSILRFAVLMTLSRALQDGVVSGWSATAADSREKHMN
eukprot:5808272-Amphidinium_carterae.1